MRHMRRTTIAAAVACLMVASCAYGIAIARWEVFPFHMVRAMWNRVANKQPSADWYPGLRKRYEEMPIAADIVMFGDSHIRLMDWSELFPDIKIANRGIPGDSVQYMLLRIEPILAARPKKVFVMAGVNDLAAGRDPEAIARDYDTLIQRLVEVSGQTIVQSTLLTTDSAMNSKITKLNQHLEQTCMRAKCKYLNLNRSLAPSGVLQHSVDGVHLDVAGYMIWRNAIADELR
jgi:hypothetical protein